VVCTNGTRDLGDVAAALQQSALDGKLRLPAATQNAR
jgi:hypothetical protein